MIHALLEVASAARLLVSAPIPSVATSGSRISGLASSPHVSVDNFRIFQLLPGNLRPSALPHTQGRVLINAQIAADLRAYLAATPSLVLVLLLIGCPKNDTPANS